MTAGLEYILQHIISNFSNVTFLVEDGVLSIAPIDDEDSFTFTGEATARGTDAGIYDMEILPEDFKNINDNFSNIKFVVAEGSGQMVITPVQGVTVTIRENGGTYTYDGSQKAVSGYVVANINHNTNFKVVNFVVEEGQLVINPVVKYSLTIRYVDTAGNVMAADYIAELEACASGLHLHCW